MNKLNPFGADAQFQNRENLCFRDLGQELDRLETEQCNLIKKVGENLETNIPEFLRLAQMIETMKSKIF